MNRAIGTLFLLVSAATLNGASRLVAQVTTNKACGLVTESEIQSVLGAKVTLKNGAIGDVQTCSCEAPTAR